MNLFCMDSNIELSISSYSNACMLQAWQAFVTAMLVLVLGYSGCFRSRVHSSSGFLKQGVWGCSRPEALGCLVSELPKIQDFECISQIIKS